MKAISSDCVLVVVDVQEKLVDTVVEPKKRVENIKALVKTARVLNVPVVVTEQEKLGRTVADITSLLPKAPKSISKLSFTCCAVKEFNDMITSTGRKTLLVCGIEAHICVLQTTLDLLDKKFKVQVVKDAISSNSSLDLDAAVDRMKDAGATITTTETLIFELTENAGTPEFKKILEIVKERRTVNAG